MDDWPGLLDDPGWSVDHLLSTLALSHRGTRLVERWSVVAAVPLDELLVELNLDGDPSGITVEVYGGTVTGEVWPPRPRSGRRVVDILLPRLLRPGERFSFHVVAWSPRGRPVGRHVYVPSVACRQLEMRVHFAADMAPAAVARVDGVPPTAATVSVDTSPSSPVDEAGDVLATFGHLRPGSTYGVRWATRSSELGPPAAGTARPA